MKANQHKDYSDEKKHLTYTLESIIDEISILKNKKYDSVNSGIVGNIIAMDAKKQKQLEKSINNPYFGKIDFKEEGQGKTENLYIGKVSLMDNYSDNENDMIIVDWRAPIASLYYDGNLGKVNYNCPDGTINGDLIVKRNFKIQERNLEEISDIDVTAIDEMLIGFLEENKDNKLRDIVATIQSEQNNIIRADIKKSLIVQGAAGGGKTTIALHRIAYLMYMLKDKVSPEEFMIVAPNKLFLNYIADVLPELGVDDVKQTTFEELVKDILAKEVKVDDPDSKLIQIVEKYGNGADIEKVMAISSFKSSIDYQKGLEAYINQIHSSTMPSGDFVFEGVTLAKLDEMLKMYREDYNRHPVAKRVELIQDYLSGRADMNKSLIERSIKLSINKKEAKLVANSKSDVEISEITKGLYEEQRKRIKDIKANLKKEVAAYIVSPGKSILKYYKDFVADAKVYAEFMAESKIDSDIVEAARLNTKEMLIQNRIEVEDFAALMYLKGKLHGIAELEKMRHVVVDEAQDTGAFQYYVLRDLMKDSTFTILGDIAQGINAHRGTDDWGALKEDAFKENCEILNLEQSYRTTVEIMDAANIVLKNLDNKAVVYAKPVLRHGSVVTVNEYESKEEIYLSIKDKIEELKDTSKSIAVICKMEKECEEVYNYLRKLEGIDVQLLNDRESEYKKQVVVVPSYLSKGLEFDSVILADVNKENYTVNDLNIKLLYVSMTRALHTLDIFANGERSELLEGIECSVK
ncbi:MAG TPA: DNA helicase [Clostridiales bacterium]|nr:MAG: hypothetical protein A2Y18_00780 [Clostridiales bacterium GWD2_32_19]HCC07240.1 DNA helicase [Clostridiales bacterium]